MSRRTHVDAVLRPSRTDIVAEVDMIDGGQNLVWLLVDHKSHPHRQVALQLAGYVVRLCHQWFVIHKEAKSIPPIIVMVLYHGKDPWDAPRSLRLPDTRRQI
jgi:hypothetical protein